MIYSTGCEYAIRGVTLLAAYWPDKQYLLLRDIAKETGMAGPYLGKLLQRLVLAGMVQSLKGRTGGYRLGKDPKKIKLVDIVKSIDGPDRLNATLVGLMTREAAACPKNKTWSKVHEQIMTLLETTTLSDLIPAFESKRKG